MGRSAARLATRSATRSAGRSVCPSESSSVNHLANHYLQLLCACLLLIITLRFTCGERKNLPTIKRSQNITNITVASICFYFMPLFEDKVDFFIKA